MDKMERSLKDRLYCLEPGDGLGMLDELAKELKNLTILETQLRQDTGDAQSTAPDHVKTDINSLDTATRQSTDGASSENSHELPSKTSNTIEEQPARQGTGSSFNHGRNPAASSASSNKGLSSLQNRQLYSRRGKSGTTSERQMVTEQGLFGTSCRCPVQSRMNFMFNSVGHAREKRCAAITACILSITGLSVALVFVAKDFWASRSMAMTAIKFSLKEEFLLPDVFVCRREIGFPPFTDLNTDQFHGNSTFWIGYLRYPRGNNFSDVYFPETLSSPNVKSVTIDSNGRLCTDPSYSLADPRIFESSVKKLPPCFHCFHITNTPPISILRKYSSFSAETSGGESQNEFRSHFSLSFIVDVCKNAQFGLEIAGFEVLRDVIGKHALPLQERGILDFGGVSPLNSSNIAAVFPRIRYAPGTRIIRDFVVGDVSDVLCNTVLFSGYFYPSTTSAISFRYNAMLDKWQRTGKGPYYPADFSSMYQTTPSAGVILPQEVKATTLDIHAAENPLAITLDSRYLRVFVNSSLKGAPLRQVGALHYNGAGFIKFSEECINDMSKHYSEMSEVRTYRVDGRNLNSNFIVSLGVSSFWTRVVSDNVTISWTAFLCDFMGLVSLFFDFSVYTLLVYPFIMYFRQRSLAKKLKNTCASV